MILGTPFGTGASGRKNVADLVDTHECAGYVTVLSRRHSRAGNRYGGVAQLGERVNGIHEVRGSIPLASTPSALYAHGRVVEFGALRGR